MISLNKFNQRELAWQNERSLEQAMRNRMKKILLLMVILCSLTLGVFPGASTGAGPVRMAYIQNALSHLPVWVALEKGYFKDYGVNVGVAGVFWAGPEIMSGFSAGNLDVAYLGIAPTITAVANKTARVRVLAQVNTDGSAIVIAKNSPIRSILDLRGKTVAVPGISTVQDFLLRKALTNSGLAINKVNIIVLKPPEMIGALRTGQIDAFIAWEPYPSKAVTSGFGRILVASRQIWPNHPCCVLVANDNFIKHHQNEIKAILKAHKRAIEFIKNHPEQAVSIAAKYTDMDKKTIRLALKNITYTSRLNVQGIREYVRFLNKLKFINVANQHTFVKGLLEPKSLKGIKK
jgi:NitT/TauT family transport system substrate-binding protein